MTENMITIEGDIKYNADNVDDFKTYEGYENSFIIENYIRYQNEDTVYFSSSDFSEIEEKMNEDDLWEDYYYYWIDSEGIAYGSIEY